MANREMRDDDGLQQVHQQQYLQQQQHPQHYQHHNYNDNNNKNNNQQSTNSSANSGGRRQVGLTPTQGHDAPYKRTSSRSSKRSRLERTSYLMATGHLDIEETKQLTGNGNDSNKHSSDNIKRIQTTANINSSNTSLLATTSPLTIRSTGDQTNIRGGGGSVSLTNSQPMNPFDTHDSMIFAHNNFRPPKAMKQANKRERGQFRQTYTEVAMPMKTSPAFEYILKDNRRRNRRCCLWLIYSTLVTICLAIVVFCSVQLVLRYQRGL